jgi:azurin
MALGASPAWAGQAAPAAQPKAAAAQPKAAAATKAAAGAGRTIEITANDAMKYSVTAITAKPGEKLRVVLKGIGTMPKAAMGHNFVLLKAGTAAMEFANAAMPARDTEFVPASMKDKVIASTKVVGPGETVEVSFAAPTKPGTYEFICSFPGHFAAGMKGTLTVK